MSYTDDIETVAYYTERALSVTFYAMNRHGDCLEAELLRPSTVNAGGQIAMKPSGEEVARVTTRTMMRTVHPAISGTFFLSDGMINNDLHSFSCKTETKEPVLLLWSGQKYKKTDAQALFIKLVKVKSEAQLGKC